MKRKGLVLAGVAAAALSLASCADLGFGVDLDSGGASPYFYGDTYLGSSYYNPYISSPYWTFGPSYTPAPPVWGNGPGSIGMPSAPQRPPQQRPPQQRPPQNLPTISPDFTIGGGSMQRPGNNGLPSGNPSSVPKGRPVK